MTKKLKPEDRPVTYANLIPILQSRCAHRGKYIGSAEAVLREQKKVFNDVRDAGLMNPEIRESFKRVFSPIKEDIATLARDQKIERMVLKTLHFQMSVIDDLRSLVD